jgi:hypothetical protein
VSPRAISVVAFLLVLALCAFIPMYFFAHRPWVGRAYLAFGAVGVLYLLLRRRGRRSDGGPA